MNFVKFIENQWKLIFTFIGLCILAGATFVLLSARAAEKEKSAQESYFVVEKKLMDLKAKQKNPKDIKEIIDFSQIKKDLEKVVLDFPNSTAARMASIHLANLLVGEKNFSEALSILQKVENKDKGLVNTLVQQQIGQLLADDNKCAEALAVWQKILQRKEAAFIHNETKIQQALCYTKMNDLKKAEEILTNLANQSTNPDIGNSSSSKEAAKYLRLIQFRSIQNKQAGGS